MALRPASFFLGILLTVLSVQNGLARSEQHPNQKHDGYGREALQALAQQNPGETINRWMLMRNARDLLNITIDTDKIDEQPLTAEELLLRMQLMAYVQKLVDKQEKKKAKEAKKAEKAQAKAALLGLPPGYWGPPPPVTVSPPLPVPTSLNLSGSEPLPPTGFWLYKKAAFLAKLFTALADAAATLPGVTTEPPAKEDDDTEADEESESPDVSSIVNVNDEEKRSVEDSDEYEGNEYDEHVYVEGPATKMVKHSRRKPIQKYRGAPKKSHGHKTAHKFHSHVEEEDDD